MGFIPCTQQTVVVEVDACVPAQGQAGAGADDGGVAVHGDALYVEAVAGAGEGQVLFRRGVAQVVLPAEGGGDVEFLCVVEVEAVTGAHAQG